MLPPIGPIMSERILSNGFPKGCLSQLKNMYEPWQHLGSLPPTPDSWNISPPLGPLTRGFGTSLLSDTLKGGSHCRGSEGFLSRLVKAEDGLSLNSAIDGSRAMAWQWRHSTDCMTRIQSAPNRQRLFTGASDQFAHLTMSIGGHRPH